MDHLLLGFRPLKRSTSILLIGVIQPLEKAVEETKQGGQPAHFSLLGT
jgi:hypothetical protein